MLTMLMLLAFFPHLALVHAQSVICVAGQCLQGFPNTTLGATLSSPNQPSIQLLPGQYSTTTNPQLLHNSLTSSTSQLSPSPGFNGSLASLPLNLALQPGMAIFTGPLYSGQSAFSAMPNSPGSLSTSPLSAKSIALASTLWAKLSSTSNGANTSFTIWESVPNVDHLPIHDNLVLEMLQSSNCSPSCSLTGGICSPSGQCQCRPNFQGSSCEECAKGFFGPSCSPCPSGCTQCDEGITGSGTCLTSSVATSLQTCNCLNGVCGSNGQCQCNPGWTKGDNGTECSKCSSGFFLNSVGDCKVCQIGCATCSGPSGACSACKQGFSLDPSDQTKCNPPQSATSTGQICPDGSFSSGGQCTPCNGACGTCTAGTANDCVVCAQGLFKNPQGQCVSANGDGVCDGSNGALVVDNVKKECEACGAKCTSCKISGFNAASTIQQLQCASCVPGSFLSNGQCDKVSCAACDSSCSACAGSATFCTACPNGQLAGPDGKCVQTCPSNTTPSPTTAPTKCQSCHPDCGGSCSGPAFNQCTACPVTAPVLSSGRCLPVCESKGHELANVPSATSGSAPLPTVSGIDTPIVVKKKLEWWQILLMALGCAFIFLVIVWIWRRRARKQRTKQTKTFAQRKFGSGLSDWKWRLVRFGEKLFGHRKSTRVYPDSLPLGDVEKGQNMPPQPVPRPSRTHRTQRSLRSEYSAPSVYSQATGPRTMPPVRQPVTESRFSTASTLDPYYTQSQPQPVHTVIPTNKHSKNPFWR
ncbi:TNFR/NGFR cysteine-rich region family protein [Flagelloscypha sp. PMI_526]|nr:TNFR/NGFR cysteine-rich region family protein [Flagelloscypha sp. PMI_526]